MSSRTLRNFAAAELETIHAEEGLGPASTAHVEGWMRCLVATGQVPDDILEGMPEISRENEPQLSPQEYECGCVAVTHITDRNYRRDERPFEMRLAIPCDSAECQLVHLNPMRNP